MSGLTLRRIFTAPDDAHELIATCSKGCIPYGHYRCAEQRVVFQPLLDEGEGGEREGGATVRLPFPATDLSWCPAKAGRDNASFLSASNSQPLQLWDCEDGELRASYVAENDSGNHTHPRCCGWLPTPTGQLLAMGGYGGHEDKSPVRFFDILYEGSSAVYAYNSAYHAGASSSNNVVSAVAGGPCGSPGLALAGYRNHTTIDVIDVRHRCPAAVLTGGALGQRGCIRSIRAHPTKDGLVFASGARRSAQAALPNEYILCWDLRKPMEPLVALDRGPSPTHQTCDFVFLAGQRSSSEEGLHLASTSSAGGLYVFDLASALLSASAVEVRPTHVEELGPTSGIASLEKLTDDPSTAGTVAVVVGARNYAFETAATVSRRPAREGKQAADGRTSTRAAGRSNKEEEEEEEDDRNDLGAFRKRTRAITPMEDDDDDEADPLAAPAAAAASRPDAANIRVVKLPL